MKGIAAGCAQRLEQAMRITPAEVMKESLPIMMQIIVRFVNLPSRHLL